MPERTCLTAARRLFGPERRSATPARAVPPSQRWLAVAATAVVALGPSVVAMGCGRGADHGAAGQTVAGPAAASGTNAVFERSSAPEPAQPTFGIADVETWLVESGIGPIESDARAAQTVLKKLADLLISGEYQDLESLFTPEFSGAALVDLNWAGARRIDLTGGTIEHLDSVDAAELDVSGQIADLAAFADSWDSLRNIDVALGAELQQTTGRDGVLSVPFAAAFEGIESGERERVELQVRALMRRHGQGLGISELRLESARRQRGAVAWFADATDASGIGSTIPEFAMDAGNAFNMVSRGGVAVGDFDRDGLDDLAVAAGPSPHVYRNDGGGQFVRIDLEGFRRPGEWTGCLWLDYDGDGWLDLMLSQRGHVSLRNDQTGQLFQINSLALLRNREGAAFTDVTDEAGLGTLRGYYLSLAAADIDGNGTVDVHVSHYNGVDSSGNPRALDTIFYPGDRDGGSNLLLRNNGNGTFADVSAFSGADDTGWTYAAGFVDVELDGDQDLYVVNDYGPNRLLLNRGDGTFQDATDRSGAIDVGNGMGLAVADLNHDGLPDMYVANISSAAGIRVFDRALRVLEGSPGHGLVEDLRLQAAGNRLYMNIGGGSFADATEAAVVGDALWSWGGSFLDFDNDGDEDLLVPNGMISGPSAEDTIASYWIQVLANTIRQSDGAPAAVGGDYYTRVIREGLSLAGNQPNRLFVNLGDGAVSGAAGAASTSSTSSESEVPRFEEAGFLAGMDARADGRATALADFDVDGDIDVVLANTRGERVRYMRNEVAGKSGALTVRLVGRAPNSQAIGARIGVRTGDRTQWRFVSAGSAYLAQSSAARTIGLGDAAAVDELIVVWPDGARQSAGPLPINVVITAVQGTDGTSLELTSKRLARP